MKILISTILIIFVSYSSYAGQRCSKDYFGNVNCYGTGSDSGYNSRTTTDYFGNTTTTDNRGNTMRCSKDYFGNLNCY